MAAIDPKRSHVREKHGTRNGRGASISPGANAHIPEPGADLKNAVPDRDPSGTPFARRFASIEAELRDGDEHNAADMVETIRRVVPNYVSPPEDSISQLVRNVAAVVSSRNITVSQYQLHAIRIAADLVASICGDHEIRLSKKPPAQRSESLPLEPDLARAVPAAHWLGDGFGVYMSRKVAAYKTCLKGELSPDEMNVALSRLAAEILGQIDHMVYLMMHRDVLPRSSANPERCRASIRLIHRFGQSLLDGVSSDPEYEQCRNNPHWEIACKRATETVERGSSSEDQKTSDDGGDEPAARRKKGVLGMMEVVHSQRVPEPAAKDAIWTAIQDVIEMRLDQRREPIVVAPTGDVLSPDDPQGDADPNSPPEETPPARGGWRSFKRLLRGLFMKETEAEDSALERLRNMDPMAVMSSSAERQDQDWSPVRQLLNCTKLGRRLWVGSQCAGDEEILDSLFPTDELAGMLHVQGERIAEFQDLSRMEFSIEGDSLLALQKAVLRSFRQLEDTVALAHEIARCSLALHTARTLHEKGVLAN